MADIGYDGEAMLHQMATNLISSHSKFVSVLDKDCRPLVFCASDDLKFKVLQANSTGSFVLVDLSAKLNITGEVQAIAVAQHQESLQLHIAVATGSSTTTSQIHILKPITPDFISVSDADLHNTLLPNKAPPQSVRLTDFHINSALNQGQWPLLVALWRPASGGSQDDVKVARVRVLADRWEWSVNLGLPQTVKDILAVCTLQTRLDEAIAYLYKYNNIKSIIVMSASDDEDDKFYTQLELPAGADPRGLASVLDSGGKSTLLVSGNGLFGFTPSQIVRTASTATRISFDPLYSTASRLTVSQTGKDFSLWFRTDDHILGYQCGTVDAPTNQGTGVRLEDEATPLLSPGSAVDFSPLFDSTSKSQLLVVLGEKDQVLLMTQSGDTKMWKTLPLMIENTAEVTNVQAFVSHIEVKDADGLPVVLGEYHLSSSGWVRALINGHESVLDSKPTVVQTNKRGIITVIVPTEDISSYFYTIDNASTTKTEYRLRNSHTFDPSKKMQDRLGTAFAGMSLRDIDTPKGKLLEGSTASDEDIREAEKALKQMPIALKDLANQCSSATTASASPPAATVAASIVKSHSTLAIKSSFSNWWDDFKKKAKDAWEWVKHKAKEVKDWVFQKINDAWHFVVRNFA